MMERIDITEDYLINNIRRHKVEILNQPYGEGYIGKSINGYTRMIAKVVDITTHKKAQLIIFAIRDMDAFYSIDEAIKKEEYEIRYDSKYIEWFIIDNLFLSGTTITVETKEYVEYLPPHNKKTTINIFIWEGEIGDEHDHVIDSTLKSLVYTDGTGNIPTNRYL